MATSALAHALRSDQYEHTENTENSYMTLHTGYKQFINIIIIINIAKIIREIKLISFTLAKTCSVTLGKKTIIQNTVIVTLTHLLCSVRNLP